MRDVRSFWLHMRKVDKKAYEQDETRTNYKGLPGFDNLAYWEAHERRRKGRRSEIMSKRQKLEFRKTMCCLGFVWENVGRP